MPKSWSKKKRLDMFGEPHMQRPDLDNYCKAILDAIYDEDSHIHKLTISKVWGIDGAIKVKR
ncbi:MAG: RusA family crossover junction endodeoxyribonuclease [Mariprofundaceae bacterium]|nr:RusA family crossover junction endodeoxyribonuclease [Mariprofundaceae bacterium]